MQPRGAPVGNIHLSKYLSTASFVCAFSNFELLLPVVDHLNLIVNRHQTHIAVKCSTIYHIINNKLSLTFRQFSSVSVPYTTRANTYKNI